MTIPKALTLKFKVFQKVELIGLCTERVIYEVVSVTVLLLIDSVEVKVLYY